MALIWLLRDGQAVVALEYRVLIAQLEFVGVDGVAEEILQVFLFLLYLLHLEVILAGPIEEFLVLALDLAEDQRRVYQRAALPEEFFVPFLPLLRCLEVKVGPVDLFDEVDDVCDVSKLTHYAAEEMLFGGYLLLHTH